MMIYRGFLACILVCSALSAWAKDYEDTKALTTGAERYLLSALKKEYPGVSPDNVKVTISSIDPRLRLASCEQGVNQSITSPRPYGGNVSLKVYCEGNKPWTIYIPAQVETFAKIAVASKSIPRGEILTDDDVELALMNTSQAGYGYVFDLKRVIGMELKRRLQVGMPVRISHVKSPKVVKKGDKVVIEASLSGVSVVTNAEALSAGELGEQIQVRNSKSDRVVDALVVAPGRVKVAL